METTAKLPVLRVVGEALRDVAFNLGGLCRIAWPYYALAAALTLAASLIWDGSWVGEIGSGMAGVVVSTGILACAVRWQRHVVVAEPLRGIAPLDRRVVGYFLWSLGFGLLCGIPPACAMLLGLATGAILHTPDGPAPFALGIPGVVLLAGGVLCGLLLFVRLGLVLPAASVGDRRIGLRAAWKASRGQLVPLAGIVILLALGLGLLGAVAGLFDAVFRSAAGSGGSATVAGVVIDALLDLVTAVSRRQRHRASLSAPDRATRSRLTQELTPAGGARNRSAAARSRRSRAWRRACSASSPHCSIANSSSRSPAANAALRGDDAALQRQRQDQGPQQRGGGVQPDQPPVVEAVDGGAQGLGAPSRTGLPA